MDQLIVEDPARIGPYRLIARLGEGGMGRVYLARSDAGRTVAVKVVQAEYAQHPEFRARFAREVDAARRVGGDWTAAVLDADTEADVPWVATQYVPGPDLTTVVAKDFGPLPEYSVQVLANRLALALRAVHEAGLIHRDLKPSNVLVTVDGPRVIDFGIARALDSLAGDSLRTRTGMLIGSPGFMSPEQVRGLPLTPASDVFCLGALLVYATTGRLLFGATDTGLNAHLFRIAEEEADLTGVPESLAGLVGECLHKDPARRPTPQQVIARTTTDRADEWLPGVVLAQLGRHAAQLLDYAPETPTAAAAAPVPAPRAAQPLPPPPAYAPTTPVNAGPAPSNPYADAWRPAAPPAGDQGPHPLRWWGLVAITLAQLLVLVSGSILDPPSLQADLHMSTADMRTAFLAYPVAFGGLLLLGGHIADLIGRKRALITGLTGLAAACALGGAATGSAMVICASALQGAFGALLWPSALSLLSTSFTDPKERGRAFGVFGVLAGGGSVIGMLGSGRLLTVLDWRPCLYVNAAVAVVAVIGAAVLVHERADRSATRMDPLGAVLGTGGFLALSYGLAKAQPWGWTNPAIVALLGGGVLLLTVFVWWQTRASSPLLPPYVFKDRNRLGAFLTMIVAGTGLLGLFLTQTFYLQEVLDYDTFEAGVALLPTVIAMIIGSTQISARLSHRVAPRLLMAPGLVVVALGAALLTRLRLDSGYAALVLPSMVLTGLGIGVTLMPLFAIATSGVAGRNSGAAAASVNSAQQLGGSLGVVAFGGILGSAIVSRLHNASGDPAGIEDLARSGHAVGVKGLPPALWKPLADATVAGYAATIWSVVGALVLAGVIAWLMIKDKAPGA
ncbi:MDR family MFS transporter [Streptomyces sp. NPDC006632]|uniref:MDR family MFS transporter n=1 Tax=Streptomyces sp. NPDC006632 TaxID=3157182 RepID=UPI0033B144DF